MYIDGHVKVYGGEVELPRRFVSRQRLCLRGISSYWVNDAIGQPFFVIEKQIDPGLIDVIKSDIVPRLLKEVPNQPSKEELAADPHLHRFVIVFDREGYSVDFFKYLWDEHRIGCLTYKKNCTAIWAEEEFNTVNTTTVTGEPVEMKLAERGVYLGKAGLLVKEVRKLTGSGHQTAIICTAKKLETMQIAPGMFARWSQENYFSYAMHHFNIDALTSYSTESFSGTETVINPRWRELDRRQRSFTGKLNQMRARYVAMDTQKRAEPSHKQHGKWLLKKAELLDEIEAGTQELEQIKASKKEINRRVKLEELAEENQFAKLSCSRRSLLNTIAMIAYRSETAMGLLLEGHGYSLSRSRALLQDLFVRSGDLLPDYSKNILNIHLHSAATPRDNRAINELLKELNETKTVFPNTELKMVFHSHAQPGFTAVLHTWTRRMEFHPHLHVLVPAVALGSEGYEAIRAKNPEFLLPHAPLAQRYREAFLARLREKHPDLYAQIDPGVGSIDWNINVKAVGRGKRALRYLAAYVNKSAFSEKRLTGYDEQGRIRLWWQDSKDGKRRLMTLEVIEFIRLWLLHVLPKGLTRVRHYGFLSAAAVKSYRRLRFLLGGRHFNVEIPQDEPPRCPCCGREMQLRGKLLPVRGPPLSAALLHNQ